MIAEGITGGDIAELAWAQIGDNEAAKTVLALRETLAAIGQPEGRELDKLASIPDFYPAFISGVATAPIDQESKVYVLNETATILDGRLGLGSGRRAVIRQLGYLSRKALSHADFQGGSFEFYGAMTELKDACRHEIPRPTLHRKLGHLAYIAFADMTERLGAAQLYTDYLMRLHERSSEQSWNMFTNPLQTP